MAPRKLPSVLELRALFDEAACDAGDPPSDGRVSGTSDAGAATSGGTTLAGEASPRPQHHALQPPRASSASLVQQQACWQASLRRLSSGRSSSGSQRGLGGSLRGVGTSSDGGVDPPPRLPLQPYCQQLSAQLRRRALAARALLEEMQAPLPGLAGGGHKPRLPSSALHFCKALAFVKQRKAGLLAGWTWGSALLIQRLPGGTWSAPVFLRLRFGSLGLTLGGQRLRAVYVLQTEEQVAAFTRRAGGVTLDAALPAELDPLDVYAPVKPQRHRELSARPDASKPQCAMLAGGLIWDLSLRAGFTYLDARLNGQLYGEAVTPEQVLGGAVPPPPELVPLYRDIDARAAEAQVIRPTLSKFELARRQSQQFAEWSNRGVRSVRGGERSVRRGSSHLEQSRYSSSSSMGAPQEPSQRSAASLATSASPGSAGSGLLAGSLALDSPRTTLAATGSASLAGAGFKLFADVEDVEFEPVAAAVAGGPGGPAGREHMLHADGAPCRWGMPAPSATNSAPCASLSLLST